MAYNNAYKLWHVPKKNIYDENGKLKRGQTLQGYYKVQHPEKYIGDPTLIIYRSSWELSFLRWCDFSPSIIRFSSEPTKIPYYDRVSKLEECKRQGLDPNNPKNWVIKNYNIDFWIEIRKDENTTERIIVEIKPSNKLKKPIPPGENASLKEQRRFNIDAKEFLINEAKFESANAFAKKHNMRFCVFTENSLSGLIGRFWSGNNE